MDTSYLLQVIVNVGTSIIKLEEYMIPENMPNWLHDLQDPLQNECVEILFKYYQDSQDGGGLNQACCRSRPHSQVVCPLGSPRNMSASISHFKDWHVNNAVNG